MTTKYQNPYLVFLIWPETSLQIGEEVLLENSKLLFHMEMFHSISHKKRKDAVSTVKVLILY